MVRAIKNFEPESSVESKAARQSEDCQPSGAKGQDLDLEEGSHWHQQSLVIPRCGGKSELSLIFIHQLLFQEEVNRTGEAFFDKSQFQGKK